MLGVVLGFLGLSSPSAAGGGEGATDTVPPRESYIIAPPPLAAPAQHIIASVQADMVHQNPAVRDDSRDDMEGNGHTDVPALHHAENMHRDVQVREHDIDPDAPAAANTVAVEGHAPAARQTSLDTQHDAPAPDHQPAPVDGNIIHQTHNDAHHTPTASADSHMHSSNATAPPQTKAEIETFVAALRADGEVHMHKGGSSKAKEHMAAMDLVPRNEATHIAIGNGDWDDPSNWYRGKIPGKDAKVLIPEGVHMEYDHVSGARLFTVRVDGHLEFATDKNSKMVVDTMVISPSGTLTIGTADDPVNRNVDVDIIFANNGRIDTDWDPMLLSRGLIAHGETSIHGARKDSHEKVADDPMKGDTWVDMGKTPKGWEVGDKIVIAGTEYYGYKGWEPKLGYRPPQDEVRIIREIKDGKLFFNTPLKFNHDGARDDLKTSVANYTRNVSFETEGLRNADVHERGHVMFMHSDDVDVRFAEFQELGRTDKSERARNSSEFDTIAFDSNVKGRYSFHFHRTGVKDQEDPAIAIGNAVYGSPGWGFVHHDSHAILKNNASYKTFGAGFVAESGNETGVWHNNIAIFAKGNSWKDTKIANDVDNFDVGQTGDGFWFQSRMVRATDNVAASVNHGFVYFHRGPLGENGQIRFDAEITEIPGALHYYEYVMPDDHPILGFSGNETFAAKTGLSVVKANASQNHDVHSFLEDFTAWNVRVGTDLSYTAHYTLSNFDLVGKRIGWGQVGITFGSNLSDITIVNPRIENFDLGMRLSREFTTGHGPEEHEYAIVKPRFIDVEKRYDYFDRKYDTVLFEKGIPYLKPDIQLHKKLVHRDFGVVVKGTKTDSLGRTDFPTGAENFNIGWNRDDSLLEHKGFFRTTEGERYYMLDILFSDRLTGDIYMEKHPVFLAPKISTKGITFHGERDLTGRKTPTIDDAILWATLRDGELVFTDEAIALQQQEALYMDDVM